MSTCPTCLAELTARFCGHCGTDTTAPEIVGVVFSLLPVQPMDHSKDRDGAGR